MSKTRQTPADEIHFLIRSVRAAMPHGGKVPRHRHPWHQLIYAERGTMSVATDAGVWTIPTGWAVWAAGDTEHAITFHKGSAYTALYIRPSRRTRGASRAVLVSPLLAALIARVGETGILDRRTPVHAAIFQVIMSEIPTASSAPLALPLPRSPDLRRLADSYFNDARTRKNIDVLARSIGISDRTLERRFSTETGMSVGTWQRHARLLVALRLTGEGKSVAAIAAATGYRSSSAFIAAFRKMFGTTPGQTLSMITQMPREV